MSGHSKWSTIKRKKGANDAQRAKIFTKIAREIIVAVKAGGPDPDNNSSLKDAIAKARSNNMPNDNINRTIKKAAGDTDGDNYESITYEGYGPAGVAVIVNALTDNRNRTAADVRHAFDKNGGNMGQTGCVSFMFDALAEKYTISSAEVSMVPQTMTELTEEGQINAMTKLLDMLEDNDDVQDVYHNWDMPSED